MTRYFSLGLLLLALVLLRLCAAAQTAPAAAAVPAATGSLTGMVLDSLRREAVPYATVVLLPPAPNDKPITGVAADEKGRFALTKLAPGPARLRVSYVGYGTQTRVVTITVGATEVGAFRLPVAGTALAEAVVIGTKPVVEVRPDRLIYNADQDVTNAGGTAADVLRKAPLLAVDGEGNVKMRGTSNFRVLVNNKPSPTLASNLAEALKSIPADQIKSVEVITTPPAKYDGEGTAGIINIVLKKGAEQGLNGRVGVASGNRNTNLNSALNFRQGKVNFTSSASVGAWYNPGQIIAERTTFGAAGQVLNVIRQDAPVQNRGGWLYGTVGIDYDIKEHHALSFAGSVNGYAGYSDNALLNQLTAFDGSPSQRFFRDTRSVFNGLNVEGTGTYTRTFAGVPRKEWSVLVQFAPTTGLFGYDFDQYNNAGSALGTERANYRERSRGRTPGAETTFQTDFTQPLGEKRTLEVGLKAIFRRTSSVATVDTLGVPAGEFATSRRRDTDFAYAQNVQAAYGTYSWAVGKKLTASLGSRLERTAIGADFRASGTGFSGSYLTWLPNGSTAYAFTEATSLRLAYSKRITRPFIDFLNPFVDRSNPNNLTFGNPNLDPELTHSAELGLNTSRGTASLNTTLSVRYTGNAIEQIRLTTPDPAVTAQTFGNVAANTFYQLNIYGSVKPTDNWTISGGPDVQLVSRRSSALATTVQGFTANLNLNTSYKLKKGWTLQGFTYAGLRTVEIQGFGPANLYYQMGAKKTIWKEKADLTLNFSSPFNRFWPYNSTTTTPQFAETFAYRSFQQGFRFAFNYRFGQQSQGKQRKSVSNDDVKTGGNKQGGQ